MLAKVEIQNFQSHRSSILEFVPGTNVIIGMSDAGKSSVFRAINWVCSNRPLGDSFRSEWGGDTRVILHTTEGQVIERLRTASKNEYIIDGKILKAFGSEVPEEVTKILRLDSANIQAQMDSPFLLADTPGEAARKLNKAASIDDIDYAMSGLRSSYARIDQGLKADRYKMAEHQEQLKAYQDIPVLEQEISEIEELETRRAEKQKQISDLRALSAGIIVVEIKLEKTKHIPDLSKKWAESQQDFAEYGGRLTELEQLKNATRRIKETQKLLASTTHIDVAGPLLQNCQKEYQDLQTRKEKLEGLRSLNSQIIRININIEKTQKEEDALMQEFVDLSPETCPLCGGQMGGPK